MNSQQAVQSEIYLTSDGRVEVDVQSDGETVWLNRQQLATLFARDVKTIGKHIANARREELADIPTVAKFATVQLEGTREVVREVEHYNLDMVLSLGYRVKSGEGIHFRRWANGVLKRYIVDGAALNEQRLKQLGQVVQILARANDEVLAGVADVLGQYLPGLGLLRDYDEARLAPAPKAIPGWTLTLEEKAANLLYLIVKDHPLSDGNKRSAAALFVTFLARNGLLNQEDGKARIANNTLAAMTLMVAMSDPKEKDLMVALIIRMLTEENQ